MDINGVLQAIEHGFETVNDAKSTVTTAENQVVTDLEFVNGVVSSLGGIVTSIKSGNPVEAIETVATVLQNFKSLIGK